jgi:hypothetical protein
VTSGVILLSKLTETKVCRKCGDPKPLVCFDFVNQKKSLTLRGTCRDCISKQGRSRHRNLAGHYIDYKREMKYGITPLQFEEMNQQQNGLCAICKGPPSRKNLDVDHDHTTGHVRGLLCSACNLAIGKFKDNPDLLEAAATYLRGHNGKRN